MSCNTTPTHWPHPPVYILCHHRLGRHTLWTRRWSEYLPLTVLARRLVLSGRIRIFGMLRVTIKCSSLASTSLRYSRPHTSQTSTSHITDIHLTHHRHPPHTSQTSTSHITDIHLTLHRHPPHTSHITDIHVTHHRHPPHTSQTSTSHFTDIHLTLHTSQTSTSHFTHHRHPPHTSQTSTSHITDIHLTLHRHPPHTSQKPPYNREWLTFVYKSVLTFLGGELGLKGFGLSLVDFPSSIGGSAKEKQDYMKSHDD